MIFAILPSVVALSQNLGQDALSIFKGVGRRLQIGSNGLPFPPPLGYMAVPFFMNEPQH
jgi:hypothetical protein